MGTRHGKNKARQIVTKLLLTFLITSPDVSAHLRPSWEKPEGAGPSLEPPLNAISRSNWNPEPADVSRLLEEVSQQ